MADPTPDPFTAIEDAAVAKVKSALGNKVRKVEDIAPNWTKDMLKQVMQAAPAVLICVTGGINSGPGALVANLKPSVSVMMASNNVKERDARRGAGTGIGAYQLIFAVVPALHGLKIAGVGELQFLSVDPVDVGVWDVQGATIYEAQFGVTEFSLPEQVDPAMLHPFQTFVADYKQAGAAGATDPNLATDTVTIDQS